MQLSNTLNTVMELLFTLSVFGIRRCIDFMKTDHAELMLAITYSSAHGKLNVLWCMDAQKHLILNGNYNSG
jgi:hypothetical protein